MADPTDPYKVLQVDSEAEDEVIQAAYRRLAQKYHPDVAAGPEGAARMSAINAAWEILRDPTKRAAHDLARRLAARNAQRAAAEGGQGPATGGSGPASNRPASTPAGQGRSGGHAGSAGSGSSTAGGVPPRPPETVSSDWTSGRSNQGGGYDPKVMGAPDGLGAAGPPPGDPSGSVLNFGRYAGWSIGEIARRDVDYIEWLDRVPIGRNYREELDVALRRAGRRKSASAEAQERRGLFRRR
jgi:curved DNA-binding protein CbpA